MAYDAERLADIGILASGLVCAVAASGVLIAAALSREEPRLLAGVSVYAIGLVAMLGCSLLYRSAIEPGRRQFFRRFDHAAIFAMIAGSATPFALARGDSRGTIVVAALWSFAVLGIVVKLRFPIGSVRRSAMIYLLLGWLSLFAVGSAVPGSTVALIVIGGVLYSAGTPFLMWWRRLPYRLAIWHSFVLAGAACHYCGNPQWGRFRLTRAALRQVAGRLRSPSNITNFWQPDVGQEPGRPALYPPLTLDCPSPLGGVTLTTRRRARHPSSMARSILLMFASVAVLVACAGPAPQTTTATTQPPGPGCSACFLENPGDVRPCVKICHQPESDSAGANAGGVIR